MGLKPNGPPGAGTPVWHTVRQPLRHRHVAGHCHAHLTSWRLCSAEPSVCRVAGSPPACSGPPPCPMAAASHSDTPRWPCRVEEILAYVKDVKSTYPELWVEATEFGPTDDMSNIFAAFEGVATSNTPLFKGVDLFTFNEDHTKITGVEGELGQGEGDRRAFWDKGGAWFLSPAVMEWGGLLPGAPGAGAHHQSGLRAVLRTSKNATSSSPPSMPICSVPQQLAGCQGPRGEEEGDAEGGRRRRRPLMRFSLPPSRRLLSTSVFVSDRSGANTVLRTILASPCPPMLSRRRNPFKLC